MRGDARASRSRASWSSSRARTFTAHAGDFVERRPFRLGAADAHGRGERSRGHVSSVVRAPWLACGRYLARNGRRDPPDDPRDSFGDPQVTEHFYYRIVRVRLVREKETSESLLRDGSTLDARQPSRGVASRVAAWRAGTAPAPSAATPTPFGTRSPHGRGPLANVARG